MLHQRLPFLTLTIILALSVSQGCRKNTPPKPEASPASTEAKTPAPDASPSELAKTSNTATKDASVTPKKIFIVQSYESDNVCGMPQGEGILNELKKKYGDNLVVETHFMNTKTTNSSKEAMKEDARQTIEKINDFKPDILFTVDDNAFREVGLELVGQDFPVIFSGMNAMPEKYNSMKPFLDKDGIPMANVTGVYEKLHVVASLSVLKGLLPDLKKVVALLDESPTGYAIEKQLDKELQENNTGIDFEIRHVGTMKQYLEQIEAINNDPETGAVYNVVLSVKDAEGQSVGMKATFKEFLEKSTKPAIALNFAFCKLGLFGGASVDFVDMGENAGRMGIALLDGQDISELPIYTPDKYLITFNHACAKKLGIPLTDDILSVAILYDEIPLLK